MLMLSNRTPKSSGGADPDWSSSSLERLAPGAPGGRYLITIFICPISHNSSIIIYLFFYVVSISSIMT